MFQLLCNSNYYQYSKKMLPERDYASQPRKQSDMAYKIQEIWQFCECNRQMIKDMQKEVKGKVHRSEYLSGMSSKLSLSQIPQLYSNSEEYSSQRYGRRQKENKSPNIMQNTHHQCEYQEQTQKIKAKLKIISEEIEQIKEGYCLTDRNNNSIHKQLNEKIQKLSITQEIEKSRYSQLQSLIFNKSDRKELDQLFTLNQLLVIQIEQAKQQSKQIQNMFKEREREGFGFHELSDKIDKINKEQASNEQLLFNIVHKENKNENNEIQYKYSVDNRLSKMDTQIDRILELIQIKESKHENNLHNQQYLISQISILKEELVGINNHHNFNTKELNNRINIIQLKENQLNRAVKDVDGFNNEITTLRSDIHMLSNHINNIHDNIPNTTQHLLEQYNVTIEQKLGKQMEVTCQQLIKKVLVLIQNLPSSQQLYSLIQSIENKHNKLQETLSKNNYKIAQINKEMHVIHEQIEENNEKTQEQIHTIASLNKQNIKYSQIKEILSNFMIVDDIKQCITKGDKFLQKQLKNVIEEQSKINEVLCSQNIIAKWFWTSGQFQGGNLVTWDKQIVNTLPQNFKWTKNTSIINISNSGYYKIELGFYSKKKPTIQIIVNGQTVVSAVNSNSYVVHHSSGKLKNIGQSQISGLTYIDFLLIPEGARVAISYNGQFSGEGFFSIQRF